MTEQIITGGTAKSVYLVDSNGNPVTSTNGASVTAGGTYNSSAPTLSSGQRSDLQLDANANLKETLATLIAGENLTTNRLNNEPIYSYAAISSATTTVVKSGAGTVHVINIIGGTLGAITVYDNTAGSGTAIIPTFTPTATLPCPAIVLDESFLTGLTIVTAAATIINVGYR